MCLAAVVYLTENAGRKSWVKIIAALGGILGVLYASNQEQSACVLGGMLCGYIFWYFMTHDKKVNIPAVLFLAYSGGIIFSRGCSRTGTFDAGAGT